MARRVTEARDVIPEHMDASSRRSSREGYLADWHPKYPNRTTDFERRAALYASYDAQLFEYTRFFAAASIINAVLAKLFATVPASRSQRCFGFLTEVGAALETTNHVYAVALARSVAGSGLDRALVCAEQGQLQRYIESQQAERPHQWNATRNELNGFLNERCAGFMLSRWWTGSAPLFYILRDVRAQVGGDLDFASEFHRILIGMKIIEYIRRADGGAVIGRSVCA